MNPWDSLGVKAADDDGCQEGHDPDKHRDDEDEDLDPAHTRGRPNLQYRLSLSLFVIWFHKES